MSILEQIPDGSWKDIYLKKIKTLNESIASIRHEANEQGWNEDFYDILTKPYYREIDKIFSEELPVIKAQESSDVLFRLIGTNINADNPKTSIVKNFLDSVSSEIGRLTKAIAGLRNERKRLPKEFDLSLTGYAGGSLYLGFSLIEKDIDKNLLQEEDVLIKSTREAIKTLGTITKFADNLDSDDLKKEIEDPRIRDYAFISLKRLSPSSRSEIEKITITGKSIDDGQKRELDVETRKLAHKKIKQREIRGDLKDYTGEVREVDLDAKRFEMRSIIDEEIEEIRCMYPDDIEDVDAKKWLNEQVKILGKVEYDANHRPKLIQVEKVNIK